MTQWKNWFNGPPTVSCETWPVATLDPCWVNRVSYGMLADLGTQTYFALIV
jgi:hypothetical protein